MRKGTLTVNQLAHFKLKFGRKRRTFLRVDRVAFGGRPGMFINTWLVGEGVELQAFYQTTGMHVAFPWPTKGVAIDHASIRCEGSRGFTGQGSGPIHTPL